MTLPPPWPYLISIPALILLGALLGWALRDLRARRAPAIAARSLDDALAKTRAELDRKAEALRDAETELTALEARLQALNKTLATARQQVEVKDQERDKLLITLDEEQASVEDARNSLHSIQQDIQVRSQEVQELLTSIDKSMEEMDLLKRMLESYKVKTARLTQQVQWQDSELRMLRHTVQAKTGEINEARALLEQRDAELHLLIRQRQQRDSDIANARKMLTKRDDELRRLLGRGEEPFVEGGGPPPAPLPPPEVTAPARRRIDVTPPQPPPLPEGQAAADADEEEELPPLEAGADEGDQDIAMIPRLADFYANQLREKGITTIRQLAGYTPEELQRMLYIPGHHSPHIEGWIKAARRLTRRHKTSSP